VVGINLSVTKEDTKYQRVPHGLLLIVVVVVVIVGGKQLQTFGPNVLLAFHRVQIDGGTESILKIPHAALGKLVRISWIANPLSKSWDASTLSYSNTW